ncbi:MAG: methyltransferase [Alphaproteobacteria bacterium]
MQARSARLRHRAEADTPRVPYVKDSELNLLWRPGFAGVAYSDGAEAERRILAAVCGARDRSTFSAELAGAITDWPSEYHLSRERHCIVRPLGIKPGDRVLELGCGCGAVTRHLGEIGAEVIGVEGAPLRARTAAERCRDLPNVTIVADDFLHYANGAPFDWVLLIGVLEYAALASDEADPVAHVLGAAASHLASGGRLAIAIENKLGLKYFNGCAEDHVGIPFHGVQGLYGAREPRTFGRLELMSHLRDAGLPHAAFHYPFPDYKLPRVLLSEEGLRDPAFDAAGLLACLHARDYGGNPHRLFTEALVAREAARNGLLEELSNSFLVVAGQERFASETLATVFSTQRNAAFATQTRFVRDGEAIRVTKQRLFPDRVACHRLSDRCLLTHVAEDRTYVPGQLLFERLTLARARGGGLTAITAALMPWFDLLLSHAKAKSGQSLGDLALRGELLDLTPFNLVETANGPVPIDMEWRIDRAIPVGWVVTRAVLHSLCATPGFEREAVSIAGVVESLCVERGLVVSRHDIDAWLEREAELQRFNLGPAAQRRTGATLSQCIMPQAQPALAERAAIDELQTQIALIHNSRSWRYSYPIRLIGQLARERGWIAKGEGVPRIARPDEQASGPATLMPRWDIKGYGSALAIVLVTFGLTRLMVASGIHLPRMLLYIAAVAVATRTFGPGPGFAALLASVAAIVLVSFQHLLHSSAFAERFATFLVCAIIAIAVSVPRGAEPRLGRRKSLQ